MLQYPLIIFFDFPSSPGHVPVAIASHPSRPNLWVALAQTPRNRKRWKSIENDELVEYLQKLKTWSIFYIIHKWTGARTGRNRFTFSERNKKWSSEIGFERKKIQECLAEKKNGKCFVYLVLNETVVITWHWLRYAKLRWFNGCWYNFFFLWSPLSTGCMLFGFVYWLLFCCTFFEWLFQLQNFEC